MPQAIETEEPESAAVKSSPPGLSKAELYPTVFVCGAMVMTVEVVGTRIIGPVFGVGLFVWSALLAITLASLAGGYYAGGAVADRRPSPTLLGSVVTASGALLALTPLLCQSVLRVAEALGPRGGPLLAAGLLFTPSLVALGMTGPIAVKLATRSLATAGQGIGSVYAVSTAGSLIGTLVVGFWAVPAFDATAILAGSAAALILVGGLSLAMRKRGLALGLLLAPLFIGGGPTSSLPPGYYLLSRSQSLLGLVEVIRDTKRGVRFLRSDHSVLGAEYEQGDVSGFGFVNLLAALRFFRPSAKTCLSIGLGTGAAPRLLEQHGITVDAVEIDPAVVHAAEQHFDFTPNGKVYVQDARAFLRETRQRYDLVIHDTFTGGTTPEHLLSVEVLKRVRSVLKPQGVLALNFAGFYGGPEAEATFAVARTVKSVFPHVRAFRGSAPDDKEPVGNMVFFASDGPLDFSIPMGASYSNTSEETITKQFTSWPVLAQVPPGPVITDARNPLGRLQIPVAEKHFEAMNQLLPLDVWLN